MSLSSLISDGEDGKDGQEEVRESVLTGETGVLTANQGGTTAPNPAPDGLSLHCRECREELRPHLRARGICGPCYFKQQDAGGVR
jgi:hypothetical protein